MVCNKSLSRICSDASTSAISSLLLTCHICTLEHPVTAIQCWSDDTLMVFSFALGFIPGRDRKQKSQQKEKQQREVCKEHCSVCQHVLGEENRKSKLKIIN